MLQKWTDQGDLKQYQVIGASSSGTRSASFMLMALPWMSRRIRNQLLSTVMTAAAAAACPPEATAQQLSYRTYSHADGLTNISLTCLRQDRSGYLLACTQSGLYAYDGRRFVNLGRQQGLPGGGLISDIAFDPDGRLVLRYSDRVFVSSNALSSATPPEKLKFRVATSEVGSTFNDHVGQLATWRDDVVLINQGHLDLIEPGTASEAPVIKSLAGMPPWASDPVDNATVIVGQGETLWVGRSDGRICALRPASETCYGAKEGLPKVDWKALIVDGKGRLLARSADQLATIDPAADFVRSETLPDQGGRYANYAQRLVLALMPNGRIVTQSADGLIMRGAFGWKRLTVANGLPDVPLTSIMFDKENELWLGTLGRGLVRTIGYGLWENWDHRDGLSSDIVWQIARQPGGPLWVATDGGIDAVGRSPEVPSTPRHYDTPSFAIAAGAAGHIWRSLGSSGVSCITTTTGSTRNFQLPPVNQILHAAKNRLWFITEGGVYVVDDTPAEPLAPRMVEGLKGQYSAAAVAADGSLWLFHLGQLIHLHEDGSTTVVVGHWDQVGFAPVAVAVQGIDTVWVGAAGGGLYRIEVEKDRVRKMTQIEPPDIRSNTIVSLLVDRRGWVWAGTDNGISVYDGRRWTSADANVGLIWNDLNQGSLFQDNDGSIWIGTTRGLSHLLDPETLFQQFPLQPVITSVLLGDRNLQGGMSTFSRDPLSVQFGILNFRAEGSVRFHYRLKGVDQSWAESAGGDIRYPSLPPGHHRLTVVAYDPLTQQSSEPISLLLRMEEPWWLWWPLLAAYALALSAAVYGLWRLRFRYLLRQRNILQQEVELRTVEIRAAQAALVLQATQDSLTKLLTRGEIQRRLVDALAMPGSLPRLTVGLLDIDHFKRINDRFGHLVGDEILRELGARLQKSMTTREYAGRYGGEEILIVIEGGHLPGVDRIHALNKIIRQPFLAGDETIYVTFSIGVAQATAHDSWTSLIGRADSVLYHAKAQGRDQIIEAGVATPSH